MEHLEEKLEKCSSPDDLQFVIKELDKLDSLNAFGLYLRGRTLFMLQKDNEALEILEKSITEDDSLHQSYYYAGIVLRYLNQSEKAVEYLKKAVDKLLIKETNTNICSKYHSALANALMSIKQIEDAEKSYRLSLDINTSFQGYSALGACLLQQKKEQEAKEYFQKALDSITGEFNNSHVNCLFNYGIILFKHQEYEKALDIFIKASKIVPNDFGIICKLVQCYTSLGNKEESDKIIIQLRTLRNELYPTINRFCREQIQTTLGNVLCYEYFEFSGTFGAPFYLCLWEKPIDHNNLPKYTSMGSYDSTNAIGGTNLPEGHRIWHYDCYYNNGSHTTLSMITGLRPIYEEAREILIRGLIGEAEVLSGFIVSND